MIKMACHHRPKLEEIWQLPFLATLFLSLGCFILLSKFMHSHRQPFTHPTYRILTKPIAAAKRDASQWTRSVGNLDKFNCWGFYCCRAGRIAEPVLYWKRVVFRFCCRYATPRELQKRQVEADTRVNHRFVHDECGRSVGKAVADGVFK